MIDVYLEEIKGNNFHHQAFSSLNPVCLLVGAPGDAAG